MSYKHHIIKERFDLQVTQAGEKVKGEFELDKHAKIVHGIAMSSDFFENLYHRGTQKVQLNDHELFPEGFESKLLMTGTDVPPNQRMVKIGDLPSGNGRFEIVYQDSNHAHANFRPYRVTVYVFSSTKDMHRS